MVMSPAAGYKQVENTRQVNCSENSKMQQQLHIKNILQLYIPLGGKDVGYAFTQTTKPSFGLTLTRQDTNESWHYQVQLISCDGSNETKMDAESLSWAKRNPYRLQINPHTSILEGLILRYKINTGVFDFRRIKHRSVRFQLQCYHLGQVVSHGSSTQWKLLPKRRIADEDSPTAVEDEVVVPVTWMQGNDIPSTIPSSEEPSPQYYSSPYEDDEDSTMLALNSPEHEGSLETAPYFEERLFVHEPQGYDTSQYMVLYNGNAEVIGNFRALNFYKASDINIKEDIRLLTDDRDPRGVLMKIDGVEYKFKEGLRGNNDANKRFVGYIAQQIESVVPQAVQLIDGILHVDYESLIPYLSESIKQNFKDINNLNTKTDQIHQVVDMMYNDFIKSDKKAKSAPATSSRRSSKRPYAWIIAASVSVAFLITVAVGVFFVLPYVYSANSNPPSSNTPPSSSPNTNPVPVPPTPLSNEQLILANFFNATRGLYWTRQTNWLSAVSVCSWEGVKCDADGCVTELVLSNNDLRGTLPESIGDLERLQVINLSSNSIGGTIPVTIGKLKNLRSLNLVVNHLRGTVPVEISMLTALESISLSSNLFDDWNIPAQWQQLTKLKYINLEYCGLVGTIPDIFGAMTQLTTLSLYGNQLEGTVPSLINTNISTLKLNSNKFSGNIPLLPRKSLQSINLQNNSFTGGLENINNVTGVMYLTLSGNNFQGEFWLRDELMSSLKALNIAGNHFTSVPLSLAPLPPSVIMCSASNNDFKCPLPEWLVQRCQATCA